MGHFIIPLFVTLITVIIPVINYSNGIDFFGACGQSRIVVLLLLFLRDNRSLYLAVALQSGYYKTEGSEASEPCEKMRLSSTGVLVVLY